jgi:RND family efflux transporter MFP subunit
MTGPLLPATWLENEFVTPTLRAHLIFASLLAAVLTGLSACSRQTDAESGVEVTRTIPVRTVAVEMRNLTETLTLTGTLDPRAEVPVVAEVPARLLSVLRNEGDRVAKGSLLAVLDDIDFRLARDRAKAVLDVAEANRAHTHVEEDRAESLLKTGGITDKDRLAAKVAVQIADAAAAQARTELAIAEQQLARCQVLAPIGGRIAKRSTDAGTMLTPGAQIFRIVDDSAFEFRATVPSADFGKVKLGEAVRVSVDALPGFSTIGKVSRITPVVDVRSRAFEVVVVVPGQRQLVSGLFARADVRVRQILDGLIVPPAALVRDGTDPARAQAFVIVGGRAERRDVTVGVEAADAVQVMTGLKAGEMVVVDPPAALGPGTQVDIQRQTTTGS